MAPGDRLGPYEIVSRIGAGGMGEVWRARDTRLDRSVAVKILPAELASSMEMRLRFEREAKTISQLNHPHICSLFDVGENYLVMELLDGESLADRLARGPLPLSEVLKLGAQIAEALDRAHRAGVVHRDLKPGNVMITKSGAKLLDFGLAKASMQRPQPLTQEGIILGTLQYMAPEQLEGREADARTDLFALGAVLYEMVTGKPAFEGETRTSLIAAILTTDPQPVSQLQPLTPPALEHVVAKCLHKDPDERWQSAHDIAAELKWIAGSGSQAAAPVLAPRRTPRERMAWITALLAVTAAAVWLATRPRPRPELLETAIATEGLLDDSAPLAFSPDGTQLAYAATNENGQRLIWIRSMARGTSRALSGTDYAYAPFWSADGRFVAFGTSNALLKKVPTAGGDVEIVARHAFGGGAWNGEGVILYTSTSVERSIQRVSAAGGEPSAILHPNEVGATGLYCPKFLPDGNHFIVFANGGEAKKRGQAGVWLATLDRSEKPRFLTPADSNASYVE
ncbi:MAG TPA: protein kinase, partial [Thermoanaerobaculia bacterium]